MDLKTGDTRRIIDFAASQGVLRNQLAYILATARWETNHTMKPVREAYWLSEDWRRKNLRYYPHYGRGYVQLTWPRNYAHADERLGLGGRLERNPDMALDTEVATKILVVGMMEGWFTGAALPRYVTRETSDFVNARRVVNGTDRAQEIAALARKYDDLLRAEGYGETKPKPKLPAATGGIVGALIAAVVAAFAILKDKL